MPPVVLLTGAGASGDTYSVLERTGTLTYRLALPPSMRQHPIFHVD